MDDNKPVQIDMVITVRNLREASFEDAKLSAMQRTVAIRPPHMHFTPYAAREADGSYTVTFR